MFIMMNGARFSRVGVQGVAVAERAYQKAAGLPKERVQSRRRSTSRCQAAPIIHHPTSSAC